MRAIPTWLPLLLSLVLLAGCTGGPDPASDRTLDLERTWELSPGIFAEVNLEMQEGEAFQATLTSDEPVAWDVHTHGDDGFEVLDNGTGREVTVTFQAPRDGSFSLLAENTGSNTTTLSVVVEGTGRVTSTVPS